MPVSRASSVASFELVDEQLKRVASDASLASYEVDAEMEVVEKPVDDVEIDEEKLELLQDAIREAVEEAIQVAVEEAQQVEEDLEVRQEPADDLQEKLKGLEEMLRKAELERAVLRIKSEEEKDALRKQSKLETEELLKKSKLESEALLKRANREKEALLKKADKEKAEILIKTVDEKLTLSNKAHVAQQETLKIAAEKAKLEEELRKREKQTVGEAYLKKMAGDWVLTSARAKNTFMKQMTTHKLPYRLAALFSTIKCKMVDDELRTVNTLFGRRFNRNRLAVAEGGLEFREQQGCLVVDRTPLSETRREVNGDVMKIHHTERGRTYVLEYKRVTWPHQKITSMFGIALKLLMP